MSSLKKWLTHLCEKHIKRNLNFGDSEKLKKDYEKLTKVIIDEAFKKSNKSEEDLKENIKKLKEKTERVYREPESYLNLQLYLHHNKRD